MQNLLSNMHTLCTDMRMLTGISVAYGTEAQHESALCGLAQEVKLTKDGFLPCVRPMKEDSLFDLASLTKLMTAAAALKLVENGRLSLNEFVGEIDKRFFHLRRVTVFDVLTFRVHLKTPGRIDGPIPREESLRRLFAVEVAEPPAVRLYSDINAMVIKYVVEAKSGRPFYQVLQEMLFIPAGMKETYAVVPAEERHRCVCYNYEHRIAGGQYILRTDTPPGTPHDPKSLALSLCGEDLCGHAGLFSSRQDMVRFAQALLCGELLSMDSLLAIAANYTGRENGDGTWRQYLGMLCFTKHPYQHLSEVPEWMRTESIGLSGFTGNHLSIDPIQKRFVLFLGNRCHNRVSNIVPEEGKSFTSYGVEENGVGSVLWTDGRSVPSSARYVYFKDKMLHAPILGRMKHLGWL